MRAFEWQVAHARPPLFGEEGTWLEGETGFGVTGLDLSFMKPDS